MKPSSLAECREEFATATTLVDALELKAATTLAAVPERPRPATRRLALDTRRIRIRDTGLRHFRAF